MKEKAAATRHGDHANGAGTPSILPRPDFHFPGEVGRTFLDSDPAQFPKPVKAPEGAPNILLILIDDCGFGQYGTFGGGIPSPTMDRLAAEGLRYNRLAHRFHLCHALRLHRQDREGGDRAEARPRRRNGARRGVDLPGQGAPRHSRRALAMRHFL
jgi:hypothetical protein